MCRWGVTVTPRDMSLPKPPRPADGVAHEDAGDGGGASAVRLPRLEDELLPMENLIVGVYYDMGLNLRMSCSVSSSTLSHSSRIEMPATLGRRKRER